MTGEDVAAERAAAQAALEEAMTRLLELDGHPLEGDVSAWVVSLAGERVHPDGVHIETFYTMLSRGYQGWDRSMGLVEYTRERLARDLFDE